MSTTAYLNQVYLLVKRLSVAYLLYLVSRILFFTANHEAFQSVGLFQFISDCWYGMRFDSFSVLVAACVFIVYSLLPFKWIGSILSQKILFWLFIIPQSVFLAFNFIDIAYFPFIKKRSTSEIFEQIGGQSDLLLLIPQFIADFWWVLLTYIVCIWLGIWLYKKTQNAGNSVEKATPIHHLFNWLLFVFFIALTVLGIRGGLQRVPIDVVNAGSMTRPDEVPIVLNSPFTIIKSFEQSALTDFTFMTEEEARKIFDPVHPENDSLFKKENVVVIILESFSKEYTKLGRHPNLTPFLDSLMDMGLNCENAYSNGTKSIEGIPAILSSLPSLMENPFINSLYATNKQSSLAELLGREGYSTAFFHGGINGTMNFNDWAAQAGYQKYYGKDEYGHDKDFDGFWGIWDEPFLQYTVSEMSGMPEPFHTAIFTLSSHHPYKVPSKYSSRFKEKYLENSASIQYADYALSQFFDSARKMPWYKNTLFVLVADHTGISEDPFYSGIVGNASIPILFYKGDNSLAGQTHKAVCSQSDILPSVLDLLGYNKSYFSFGESILADHYGNDFFYTSGTYLLFGDTLVRYFQALELGRVHDYKKDSLLYVNLKGTDPKRDSMDLLKFRAFLQTYNRCLINNKAGLEF